MAKFLTTAFAATALAASTAAAGAGASPVDDSPDQPITIQATDLLANDGQLSFSMEAGRTVFNGKCWAGEGGEIDPEDVQCRLGVYIGGGEHLAITNREGNKNSKGPSGEKYNEGRAMEVRFDFDKDSGALLDIDILKGAKKGAKAKFTSSSWETGIYEIIDESEQAFKDIRKDIPFEEGNYSLSRGGLTSIERALQAKGAVSYQGSMRPVDDVSFVGSSGPNNVFETNFKLLGENNTGLDAAKKDSFLAVGITREYNKANKVITTLSFDGITLNGMASDKFSFEKEWGLAPNGHYNEGDFAMRERLEDALPKGYLVK